MSGIRDAKQAAGGAGSLIWVQGLACGAVLTFAPAMAVLLVMLFWPVVVAFVKDGEPGRPSARSVALCTGAAAVSPIRAAWLAGFDLDVVFALATDWHTLATAWCAAAAGWLLAGLAPFAARAGLDALAKRRTARLRAERSQLLALWEWENSADPEL
ncbi:MAG TPA: hypothetical protein VJ779_22225 [Acetobacteraceae bacterium]|jgi:hypothetical protein|nr:hypothetical protein [Acetobacteraceae bacterium]